MKSLLHITYSGLGGMTEAVLTLVEAAPMESYRHHILFYGSDELPGRIVARCQQINLPFSFIQKAQGNDLASLSNIGKLLQRIRPDVVFSHMTQPVPALFRYRLANHRARVISIEHHSNALKTSQDWLLTLFNHHLSDHTVYLTPEYKEQVRRKLGPLHRESKVTLIPNGIDTGKFAPDNEHRKAVPLLIGMAARMVDGKDYSTLLHAFNRLLPEHPSSGIRLQLAGDGPDQESIVSLAGELGIQDSIDFLGNLPQEALISTMQTWHIFVLSTEGETMSRSIMEAQSLGLPILSTRVSGVTSSVEEGTNGLLVDPRNPAQMAQALHQLLASSQLRAALGQASREKALHEYSSREMWKRYEHLAHSLF